MPETCRKPVTLTGEFTMEEDGTLVMSIPFCLVVAESLGVGFVRVTFEPIAEPDVKRQLETCAGCLNKKGCARSSV